MPAASQYTVKKTSANAFALCTYMYVCVEVGEKMYQKTVASGLKKQLKGWVG